jgi:hypothetical protein
MSRVSISNWIGRVALSLQNRCHTCGSCTVACCHRRSSGRGRRGSHIVFDIGSQVRRPALHGVQILPVWNSGLHNFAAVGGGTPPMFFVCIANTGVTGAIVVCVANAGVKVECFHTLKPPLVSAESKGLKCYIVSYYSDRFGGICGDGCVNQSHFGQFPSVSNGSADR